MMYERGPQILTPTKLTQLLLLWGKCRKKGAFIAQFFHKIPIENLTAFTLGLDFMLMGVIVLIQHKFYLAISTCMLIKDHK